MDEMNKHGRVGEASMKAGMDRKTGRKYQQAGALSSELAKQRDWRTRQDAFEEHWPEVEAALSESPGLEAKTVFEQLVERYPGRYEAKQLRTLQRRVKACRAERGPDKEVMLAQRHRPGEAAQTDFTSTTELGVSIGGEQSVHLLCVFVLPYSNLLWVTVCLSEWSTVRVKECAYSVPSRLIGERVRARVFEERIEVWYANKCELNCERLRGQRQHRIDYRHIIWSLVRKPGGFARYVYKEEMFPSVVFRKAYDAIHTPHRATNGDLEYLRILHHAASTMEADVEAALLLLLEELRPITAEAVKALVAMTAANIAVPELVPPSVDLGAYDALIAEVGT